MVPWFDFFCCSRHLSWVGGLIENHLDIFVTAGLDRIHAQWIRSAFADALLDQLIGSSPPAAKLRDVNETRKLASAGKRWLAGGVAGDRDIMSPLLNLEDFNVCNAPFSQSLISDSNEFFL